MQFFSVSFPGDVGMSCNPDDTPPSAPDPAAAAKVTFFNYMNTSVEVTCRDAGISLTLEPMQEITEESIEFGVVCTAWYTDDMNQPEMARLNGLCHFRVNYYDSMQNVTIGDPAMGRISAFFQLTVFVEFWCENLCSFQDCFPLFFAKLFLGLNLMFSAHQEKDLGLMSTSDHTRATCTCVPFSTP